MILVCWFFFFKSHNFPAWDVSLSKKFSCATSKQLFSFLQSTKKIQSNKSHTATNCSSRLHKFSPIKTSDICKDISFKRFFKYILLRRPSKSGLSHLSQRLVRTSTAGLLFCTETERGLRKAREETNSLAGKFLDFRQTPWRTCCRISCLQERWMPRDDKYLLLQVISQLQAIEKLTSKPVGKNQAPSMEQKVQTVWWQLPDGYIWQEDASLMYWKTATKLNAEQLQRS